MSMGNSLCQGAKQSGCLVRGQRLSPLLAPLRLARPVARASEQLLLLRAFRIFQSDVEQDFVIWQHKAFVPRPALANGDGPVMRYRRWAEQFYEGSAVAS